MAKKKDPNIIERKPDNSSKAVDGGYEFTAWGVHVVAEDEKTAKELVQLYHGIDVDKDVPPAPQE